MVVGRTFSCKKVGINATAFRISCKKFYNKKRLSCLYQEYFQNARMCKCHWAIYSLRLVNASNFHSLNSYCLQRTRKWFAQKLLLETENLRRFKLVGFSVCLRRKLKKVATSLLVLLQTLTATAQQLTRLKQLTRTQHLN